MEETSCFFSLNGQNRVSLAQVVSDCVKRWFQDTLKEVKAGDIAMQVLVGQMGVPGLIELPMVELQQWKVSDKHSGYNASDSDSDEAKGDKK